MLVAAAEVGREKASNPAVRTSRAVTVVPHPARPNFQAPKKNNTARRCSEQCGYRVRAADETDTPAG